MKRLAMILPLVLGVSAAVAQDEDDLARLKAISESETMVMVPMRDGVKLATDVHLPKGEGPFPVIFVKTPYNFNKLRGTSLKWALEALERGYAYVVQNERGRYYSEGDWEILGKPRTDGWDSLDWLAAQEWSTGKVATWGCSSTAEWQMALAAQGHPAHAAMIPMAAGAGIGRVGEFYEQGNWYKGGVHQTLFAVWLYSVQQNIRPTFPAGLSREQLQRLRAAYDLAADMPEVDWKKQLRKLPSIEWLEDAGGNEGPFAEFMRRTPDDPRWYEGGLYHDGEDFRVPAFWFNSWFDVSQGPNLALYNHARTKASKKAVRDGQYMVVAPTLHCGFYRTPEHEDLIVGELNVGDATFPYYDTMFAFLDHYLKGEQSGFHEKTPRVQFFTMGRNAWSAADRWPPQDVEPRALHLASDGRANSVFGDGRLSAGPPSGAPSDAYTYDPMNPVPALGGGVCCNAGVSPGGSFDQRGIEARADVLVYTGDVLEEDLEVTGFVRAKLFVSSDAKDTDFTVKLVDVHPDGSAYNVDDTILRVRYREGYDKQVFMKPGEIYELNPTPMSTSHVFKRGHRVRVEVSSSKFPQYMRNLNTGGNNYDETEGVAARNRIHHSPEYPSSIVLPVRPAPFAVSELGENAVVLTSEPFAANSLLVRTAAGEVVLVDSPTTPQDTAALLAWVEAHWGKSPRWAINSHWHADATAGNQVLIARGVEVIGSATTAKLLRERGDAARESLIAMFAEDDPQTAAELRTLRPTPPDRVVEVGERVELSLGGETVVLVYPGPSHSADSIAVFFPEKKLLYGGCAVRSNGRIVNRREADFAGWVRAMDVLETLGAERVVPGHGRRFDPAMIGESREAARAAAAEAP